MCGHIELSSTRHSRDSTQNSGRSYHCVQTGCYAIVTGGTLAEGPECGIMTVTVRLEGEF